VESAETRVGVRLRVAYDGSSYVGWQRQPEHPSVQGALEAALSSLLGEKIEVRGASRTDAGVHAYGQVAAFDSPRELPMNGWIRALNGKLDDSIAVVEAAPCAVGYQPRFDAMAKTYRYLLHLGPVRDPLLTRRAWHLGPRRARPREGVLDETTHLDLDGMRAAASVLEGEHDFRAFRSAADERENTIRTLSSVRVIAGFSDRKDVVAIEVRGTAFLHNMVRIVAGTLVDVGRERLDTEAVRTLLTSGDRARGGETAPPWGLYLVEVELGRSASVRT
jgi:tRNA pseudouridine38-40 synthase